MAKIDEATLTPDATTDTRGSVVIRRTKHGAVAAAWPSKVGKWKTPYAFYTQQNFGLVARQAASPEPLAFASAINIAKDSQQVARDILMMAAYGLLYELKFLDGTPVEVYRVVAPNSQLVLDQVTEAIGSLLYRSEFGWVGLDPQSNGFNLRMLNGLPSWQPGASGGGGGGPRVITLFESSGLWTPNADTTYADVFMVGAGGGAGSGARRASGTATCGGAGAGGGAANWQQFNRSQLDATEDVVVAAGGVGGAARTTDNVNGNPGANGGNSSMTFGPFTMLCSGGTGAGGGSTIAIGGGPGGAAGRMAGGAGSAAGVGGGGGAPAGVSLPSTTGGGSGAGVSTVPATRNGGGGGAYASGAGLFTVGAAGGIGATKVNPVAGFEPKFSQVISNGAGGGWFNVDGSASLGANGGKYGGGGGGGGSSLNGQNSGKGGDGGGGAVLIIEW